jgi:hypothetical protein
MLLLHLVGRQHLALDRLVGALRVGGWLAIEEYDAANFGSADSSHPAHDIFNESVAAEFNAISDRVDPWGGRHVAALLIRHPTLRLVDLDVTATIQAGGSRYAQFYADSYRVALAALADTGKLPTFASDVFYDALGDPTFHFVTELRYKILAQKVEVGT